MIRQNLLRGIPSSSLMGRNPESRVSTSPITLRPNPFLRFRCSSGATRVMIGKSGGWRNRRGSLNTIHILHHEVRRENFSPDFFIGVKKRRRIVPIICDRGNRRRRDWCRGNQRWALYSLCVDLSEREDVCGNNVDEAGATMGKWKRLP